MEENKIIIPEEYSYQKLKKLYNEAGLTDEKYKLLRRYFRAMAHFYGAIEMYKAFELVCKYENDRISYDEFKAFAGVAVHEQTDFYIFDDSEIFLNVSKRDFDHKRIIDVATFVDGNAADLITLQSDKPYYVPEKEYLLRYESMDYSEKTPQYTALCKYLEKFEQKDTELVRKVILDIPRMNEFENNPALAAVEMIDEFEIIHSKEGLSQEFLNLLGDYFNNSRLYSNRGYTPNELRELFGARSIQPVRTTEKVGRNDPCPCGSGKKYKKCCGK